MIRTINALVLLAAMSVTAALAQPPDMLPYTAILDPQFVAADASSLQDDDIVVGVARGKVAKAYPAGDLAQHGSVNDQMPDGPIEVTWCGVCNTGAVFRAKFKGQILHFEYDSMVGSNEVHKDHETGSRWQQSTGEAISGPLKGSFLELYPFVRTSWKEWRTQHPNTVVLKSLPKYAEIAPRLSKMIRQNTLLGEGAAPKGAFGKDERLRPRETIAGLRIGGEAKAYPFSALRTARVVNDVVGAVPVLVVHQPPSDTTTAFESRAKGKALHFEAVDADASSLTDLETHSSWNAYGLCLAGKLKGTQLKTLILVPEFWFAWSEFHPQTKVFATSRQLVAGKTAWEPLLDAPVPPDSLPNISVVSIRVGPAKTGSSATGPGHTHPGPVFGYILQGRIENQVEPDPPHIYAVGDFFQEEPMHVHRFLRNLSTTELANVIVFQEGADNRKAASVIKILIEEPLPSTTNQEVRLMRLTLSAGAVSDGREHSGPAFVYVVDGTIETSGTTHGAGDLFLEHADPKGLTYRNASNSDPAKLLVYYVSEKHAR